MSGFAIRFVSCLAALVGLSAQPVDAVTIATVPVGNPRNAADTRDDPNGFGAVDYNFRIGKYEVTNAQYTEFLNAVAVRDSLALYDANMGSSSHGGITRIESSGRFTYATKPGMENKPVNFVSWYDAIRFANWMHNGQGNGNTEDGAYTLLGRTSTPSNGQSITRNPGARWWLTSEDEWYKAAYHKNDGVTGNYWEFPTSSDSIPTHEPPPGETNSANYAFAVATVTDAGAYVDSPSPYGTFDQGGNAFEWNETLESGFRGLRGGAWFNDPLILRALTRSSNNPSDVDNFAGGIGFRVATIPEPSTLLLVAMVGLGMLWLRRPAVV